MPTASPRARLNQARVCYAYRLCSAFIYFRASLHSCPAVVQSKLPSVIL